MACAVADFLHHHLMVGRCRLGRSLNMHLPLLDCTWDGTDQRYSVRTFWYTAFRVGQNHIYTVYIRYFWLGNHQIYGVYIRIYTVLANTNSITCWCITVFIHVTEYSTFTACVSTCSSQPIRDFTTYRHAYHIGASFQPH